MSTPIEILIVDDDPRFRTLVHKKLKALGYRTVLAHNGEEALVALWEKQNIGMVLLDVRLPFINGLNISEIIRKDFLDIKIIVCSTLQKDEQKFLIHGADEYFFKSENLNGLIEKIDKILHHNKSRVEALSDNEKRSFRRVPVNIIASCEKGNRYEPSNYAHFLSITKDLSSRGGRFIVGEDIKVGQYFSVALELPANFLPLLINCEVVWVKKLEEFNSRSKESVEAGVRFVKLDSPRDEEKLKNYLNHG